MARKATPVEVTATLNPPPRTRLAILVSFPLLILLALPFWWYTTSIERLPLPEARIDALENFPTTIPRAQILLTADSSAFPTPPPGRKQFETRVILESLGKEVTKGVDGIYAQQPEANRDVRWWDLIYEGDKGAKTTPLRVHIRRWEHANSSFPLEPYVQPPESGLMTSGIPAGTLVIPVHPGQIADRQLKLHYKIALINGILSVFPPNPPEIPLRALKYTPNITLSFVLLNEDASEGSYARSWDIEAAIRDYITPHLDPLRTIFNFTIESQVLYHAPLAFEPSYTDFPASDKERTIDAAVDAVNSVAGSEQQEGVEASLKELVDAQGEKAWMIDGEQMKVFVNSERWSLDSGSTNNPVLRFLLYVPSVRHRPMRLAVPDSAQSFLLPQFGGVVLLNPPSTATSNAYHLSPTALAPSFHLFTQHLYSLLALPSLPYTPNKLHRPPPPSPLLPPSDLIQPITPWQVYQVLLARMIENTAEAKMTLKGIVRLVRKIREMKVGKGVRGVVLGAVERLEKAQRAKNSSVASLFILARDAVVLANQAFFDPSMMGLLYFPDEHKFAVYTPLFAPIAVPLILGLLKEFVARRKRRSAKPAPQQEESEGSSEEAVLEEVGEKPAAAEIDASNSGSTWHPEPVAAAEPSVPDNVTRSLRSRSRPS
ncbi:hypothetical protein IAT38_003620 [Cryptococcus sp. DSM 104549]